jgi:integrase
MKRARYQKGCLQRVPRKAGSDVWEFRWRETAVDGRRRQRKRVLGTVEQYRTPSAAWKSAGAVRIDINQEIPRALVALTFAQVVTHYIAKELPEDACMAKVPKAFSTAVTYRRYLRKWILPRWSSYELQKFTSVAVEDWLHQLALANGTRAKIRNIMSAVFRHAIRYGFLPRDQANPMQYVRQSAASNVVHTVFTTKQVADLLGHLGEPARTMALLDALTGLRISELLALKWGDIDFARQQLHVSRAIVYGVVGQCKSKASQKPVPLVPGLARALRNWKSRTPYTRPEDWVFASATLDGAKPLNPSMLLRRHLQPAAKKAGVSGRVGWHTFRRTVASLLIENGEDIKVVQESLRHANSKVTLDLYAQATTLAKRNAQSRLAAMIVPSWLRT